MERVELMLELELGTSRPHTTDLNANVGYLPQQQKLQCPSFIEGWTRVERERQSGKSAGRIDVFYKGPTGKLVRSKPELRRILGKTHDQSMVSSGRYPKPQNDPCLERGGSAATQTNTKTFRHNVSDESDSDHMKTDPRKCDTACLKLPESLYKLPADILDQLTASPLDTLKQLVITPVIQQSHMKILFDCLAKATALKEVDFDGSFRSGSFSEVATEVALVLSRCSKIKLKHFKETDLFWKNCMTSVKNNCREFTVVECNGLETMVTMLPDLLPTLIRLEVINPDRKGFRHVQEKRLFLKFFQKKISHESKLEFLTLDKLRDLLLDVPPEILVPALAPLTSISICRTSLSLPQLVPLVKSWRELHPVSLYVESCWGCWNQLAFDLLVPSVSNISSLSLKGVKLETIVLRNLLSAVGGSCAVKKLDLRGNDMSNIAPDILVAAMHKLRVAVFTKCNLGEEAVMEMLWSLISTDDYQGELDELHLTRPRYTFDMTKEEELVKLVKEGAGLSCLEICAEHCKCEQYCNWKK